MSGWQVGDMALCVRKVGPAATLRTGIRQGGVYAVEAVVLASDGRLGLRFGGVRHHSRLRAAPAYGFVKITPGHQIEGSEVDQRDLWAERRKVLQNEERGLQPLDASFT